MDKAFVYILRKNRDKMLVLCQAYADPPCPIMRPTVSIPTMRCDTLQLILWDAQTNSTLSWLEADQVPKVQASNFMVRYFILS